jgi:hypothetical protein
MAAVWYFENNDQNWEHQARTVQDAELAAAGAAQSDRALTKSKKGSDRADRKKSLHEYYSSI